MITIGRYTWTPRRMRPTTWQMTLTKLVAAPVLAGAAVVALIGWTQPYVLHQEFTQDGVAIVEVQQDAKR